MTVQVLLSCMYEKDYSIISRSNIQSDVVVVNQCDTNSKEILHFKNKKKEDCKALFINTTERGLSKSRNMALKNAEGDICIVCDDDEEFFDNYVEIIKEAYSNNPKFDIITLEVVRKSMKSMSERRLNWINALKVASVTITFKRQSIIDNQICFEETIGSGISKAGGEENVFLYDSLRHGLKGLILPIPFARLREGDSKWFKGFTKEYFYDRGLMTKRLMGRYPALLYALYFLIRKKNIYCKDISISEASKYLLKGILNR